MLTPLEIQNKNIKNTLGGYNKKDTDDFLDEISKNYEELYNENRELKEKMASLSDGIQYYKKMEGTLQKALILAEKTSSETQEAANAKAKKIEEEAAKKISELEQQSKFKASSLEEEAQARAKAIEEEAQARVQQLENDAIARADSAALKRKAQLEKEIADATVELTQVKEKVKVLAKNYEAFHSQFKKLATAQLEMLESDNLLEMKGGMMKEIGMSDMDSSASSMEQMNYMETPSDDANIIDEASANDMDNDASQDDAETIEAAKEEEPVEEKPNDLSDEDEQKLAESMVRNLASQINKSMEDGSEFDVKDFASLTDPDALNFDPSKLDEITASFGTAASSDEETEETPVITEEITGSNEDDAMPASDLTENFKITDASEDTDTTEEESTDETKDNSETSENEDSFGQLDYSDIFNTSAPVPETPFDSPEEKAKRKKENDDDPFNFIDA